MTFYIGKEPTIGNYAKMDSISAVNGQATYNLLKGGVAFAPQSSNHVICSLNSIIQNPGSSFTISGSQITFASNLATGDSIDFILVLGDVLSIGTPSDDTIDSAKLKTNSVIEAKIQNNAVTTDKINNDAVTKAKVNFISDATAGVEVKGDGGSNDGYIQLNCSQNSHGVKIKSPPHSAGQSYTLTLPQSITNDYYLKTDGSGNLSFSAVSSDWVKIIQTNVTSGVASVSFVNGTGGVVLDSTYRIYKLIGSYRGDSNGAEFQIRVMNSGSARSSGYLCEVFRSFYSGGTSRANATDKIVRSSGGVQASAGQRGNFEATFFNMFDTDHNTTAHCQYCAIDGSGETENQVNNGISSGVYATPEAHNGIEFSMSSGNVAEAEFTLIGLKG